MKKLFKHKTSLKIEYIVPIAVIVVLLLGGVILKEAYTQNIEVRSLDVYQDELDLRAKWDDSRHRKYHVGVYEDDKLVEESTTTEGSYTLPLTEVDHDIKVVVTPDVVLGSMGEGSKTIHTHKAKQNISFPSAVIEGFKGTSIKIDGQAKTAITYSVADKKKAKIAEDGKMKFLKTGETTLTASTEETDLYEASETEIPVTVYPSSLSTPEVETEKLSDSKAKLSWKKVPYAEEYVVSAYDYEEEKFVEYKAVGSDEDLELEVDRDGTEYIVQAKAELLDKKVKSEKTEPIVAEVNINMKHLKIVDTIYRDAVELGCTHVFTDVANSYEEMKRIRRINCNRIASYCLQEMGYLDKGKTMGHTPAKPGKTTIDDAMYGRKKLKNCDVYWVNKVYADMPDKYKVPGAVYIQNSNACVSGIDGYIYSCNMSRGYSRKQDKYVKFEDGVKGKKGYPFSSPILVVVLPKSQ